MVGISFPCLASTATRMLTGTVGREPFSWDRDAATAAVIARAKTNPHFFSGRFIDDPPFRNRISGSSHPLLPPLVVGSIPAGTFLPTRFREPLCGLTCALLCAGRNSERVSPRPRTSLIH